MSKGIPKSLRLEAIARAKGYCEYCQTNSQIVITMEVDHILPFARGGKTVIDNLCLACQRCNGSKHDFITGIDPQTGNEVALYHPRRQTWSDHFQWHESGVLLIGLTETGRATIQRLQINRDNVVNSRRVWVRVGLHPPKDE